MSILYSGSAANTTTNLWLGVDSSLGGSYAEIMSLGLPKTFTNATYVTLGSVTFPNSLTNNAILSGWIELNTSGTTVGTFYLSTSPTAISTGSEGITIGSASGVRSFNLTGLQCPCAGVTTVYLAFVPSGTTTGSVIPYSINPQSFVYSTMPSNSNVGKTYSDSMFVIAT
jgi:hypothetical protein